MKNITSMSIISVQLIQLNEGSLRSLRRTLRFPTSETAQHIVQRAKIQPMNPKIMHSSCSSFFIAEIKRKSKKSPRQHALSEGCVGGVPARLPAGLLAAPGPPGASDGGAARRQVGVGCQSKALAGRPVVPAGRPAALGLGRATSVCVAISATADRVTTLDATALLHDFSFLWCPELGEFMKILSHI